MIMTKLSSIYVGAHSLSRIQVSPVFPLFMGFWLTRSCYFLGLELCDFSLGVVCISANQEQFYSVRINL